MPRKFIRRYLPSADAMREHRMLAGYGAWLHHPNLWHLNRDSVAGGVAIGLFAGLLPAPLQMLSAALLAVLLRRNLPVAVLTTLYTNPFTFVPIYLLAYAYGSLILGAAQAGAPVAPFEMDWGHFLDSMQRLLAWTLSLGPRLVVGVLALGATLAALGYFAVRLGWRAYVVLAWRARRRRRAGR
jgi:uncharacterized protein (DUF2062 family)